MVSLKEKIIFISGASSGIGMSCAEYFAREGANLILCARNIEKLNDVSGKLRSKYKIDVLTYKVDVRNKNAVMEMIDSIPQKWKSIDILINNAGLARGFEKVHEGKVEEWEEMIDTNIKGLLYLTRLIVSVMVKNNSGHIINIGSIAGTMAYPKGTVYCATKAAVRFISDGLRTELVDTPIRVTNIQPGAAQTNFSLIRFNGDKEKADNVYNGIIPLTADDIADAVLYSASTPPHVQIAEITITPTNQANPFVIYKKQN